MLNDTRHAANAAEARQLLGCPRLSLSELLSHPQSSWEGRRQIIRDFFLPKEDSSVTSSHAQREDPSVSSSLVLSSHYNGKRSRLDEGREPPPPSHKTSPPAASSFFSSASSEEGDVIDWSAETWRQRREQQQSEMESRQSHMEGVRHSRKKEKSKPHDTETEESNRSLTIVEEKAKRSASSMSSTSLLPSSSATTPSSPPSRYTKWKTTKILVGHQGWVWCAAVDPTNHWFATGGFDTVIKIWDLASGALKLNLISHKEGVRSVAMSKTSPYLFSGSDDHSIKCWDLERNEVVREFFGHRSAVHAVSVHPMLDVVVSGGRDHTVRVWDIRTRRAVHTLLGHQDSVMSLVTQTVNPQIISGGSDGFIYLWDLGAGKAMTRLTRHKKPVRGLALSPSGGHLVSCGADEIRLWEMNDGNFYGNASTIVPSSHASSFSAEEEMSYWWSSCAMSARGTLAVGSQDGHLVFYDWNEQVEKKEVREKSIHPKVVPFYRTMTTSISGTREGEGGIQAMVFDISGTRLITAESDKSVKLWQRKEKEKTIKKKA